MKVHTLLVIIGGVFVIPVVAGAAWALIARRCCRHIDVDDMGWPAERTPAQAEATLREQLEIDHQEWHEISCRLVEDLVLERAPHHNADFAKWEAEVLVR